MRASKQAAAILLAASSVLLPFSARSVPGTFVFDEDPRCDPHDITLTHELGIMPPFPAEEAIAASAVETEFPFPCVLPIMSDPPPKDFIITITNLTAIAWTDLFFVADAGIFVGNADGKIKGGDAFKIDTAGVNPPLISESDVEDLVFSPGETWVFVVIDWSPTLPGAVPTFGSIAVGADSVGATGSWASIVANPMDGPPTRIAEPASGGLLALGVLAAARARRGPRAARRRLPR